MRFSEDFLTELRARTDLVDLVSRYTDVKNRSTSRPVALCPFHSEKTPSFVIYTNNQSYYCFGCGAGGDAVTFVKNIERLDYVEAVRFLCERAGMQMPTDPVDDAYAKLRRRCYEANREAARFFHEQLKTPGAAAARAYIEKRKLKPETVTHFGLGYAPDDWHALTNHLKGKGFTETELISFDLARKSQKTGRAYDTFRNRLMFPFIDLRGNVIAFGARVLDDSKPKYLNTSDTAVYKKGQGIYALNFAKNAPGRRLILCEGYMDVIAMHQAGYVNAVASLGTAFTNEQISLLSRYCDELYLSFDSDEAGRKATQKALRLLSNAPMKLRVLELSGGKDADEILKTDGRGKMDQIIRDAKNDTEYALSRAAAGFDLATDNGKLGYLNEAVTILAGVKNTVEQDLYITRVAEQTGTSKEPLVREVRKTAARQRRRSERDAFERDARAAAGEIAAGAVGASHNPERRANLRACRAEETLLANLLQHPDYLKRLSDTLAPSLFITALNRSVFEGIAQRIRENRALDFAEFNENGQNEEASYLAYLGTLADRVAGTLSECEDCIDTLLACRLEKESAGVEDISDQDFMQRLHALRERKDKQQNKPKP